LFEDDPLPPPLLRPELAGRAIDDLRPGVLRQLRQKRLGQYIAAVEGFVFQDAVVEEVDRRAVVNAEERGIRRVRGRQGALFQ